MRYFDGLLILFGFFFLCFFFRMLFMDDNRRAREARKKLHPKAVNCRVVVVVLQYITGGLTRWGARAFGFRILDLGSRISNRCTSACAVKRLMNSNRYAQLILYKAWPDLCRRRRRSRAFVLSGFCFVCLAGDLSEFFFFFLFMTPLVGATCDWL